MSATLEQTREAIARIGMVSRGVIKVRFDGPGWDDVFAGDVTYVDDDGWRYVVFNDCYSWDYVDSVTSPDGVVVDYDDMNPAVPDGSDGEWDRSTVAFETRTMLWQAEPTDDQIHNWLVTSEGRELKP